MSALQFLNKKSWHTSTIRNNEKVWLAEQSDAKEQARVAELQKQLEEERKLEEIQRLEIESGRLDPAEVLKRRRLNWMYEHGASAADDADARKEHEEKERDDILLGKKKVDLDEIANEEEDKEKAFLVDAEAKFREDPLVQIQKQTALAAQLAPRERRLGLPKIALPARKSSKYTPEELAAKKSRKEERRVIREERRRRKEEKALQKRSRAEQYEAKFYDVDVDPKDENDAKLFDKEDHTRPDKHRELSPRREESRRVVSPRCEPRESADGGRYGLHIPIGGTGVAVTTDFVPRTRDEMGELRRSESFREDRTDQPPLSSPRRVKSERASRPPLSPKLRERAEEKRQILKDMKEDALRLEDERRRRAQKHVQDANREREAIEDRLRRRKSNLSVSDEEPAMSFARETFARGRSTADRIRQRRAWAAKDSNASY